MVSIPSLLSSVDMMTEGKSNLLAGMINYSLFAFLFTYSVSSHHLCDQNIRCKNKCEIQTVLRKENGRLKRKSHCVLFFHMVMN